ncbi:MAG: hypothetical protein ACLSHC_07480 [Bilophila wadsworthia]
MISDDEGPFAPERSGGLPCFQLAKWRRRTASPSRDDAPDAAEGG